MTRSLLDDVRFALRSFLKHPRFAIVAAATLALGVGLVTAIFSVVNGVLLKPLPNPEPGRLVNIWSNAPGLGYDQFGLSPDIYYFLRDEHRGFADMTMYSGRGSGRGANLTGAGEPGVVPARVVTHTFFKTLGITPAAGAVFGERDDQPGAPLVALISHRLWQQRFARAATAIGQAVQVDGTPATIVGVMPAWFDEIDSPDLIMPARLNARTPPTGNFGWSVAARLAPGVSAADAEAAFVPLMKRFLDERVTTPDYRAFMTTGHYRVMVHPMKEDLIGDVERPLWILLGTVLCVLLIACANVANLMLIRADGRRREIAVRSALGAPRSWLIRTQLVEACVLAVIGGILGVVLAAVAVPALIRLAPSTIPRLNEVAIDPLVLVVAAAATTLSALVFGLAPAFRYTRAASVAATRQGARGSTADRSHHRARKLLVVLQTALTLVLLVGSGLLARSFSRMLSTDLGFRPEGVTTFRLTLPESSYKDGAAMAAFDRQLVERLSRIPGVESVGSTSHLPITASASGTAFVIDGQPVQPGQLPPMIHYVFVKPGYLETMKTPLIEGRYFDRRDDEPGRREVIVNKVVADRFWPKASALGKRFRPSGADPSTPWFVIAGVVAPVLHNGVREEPPALIYYPATVQQDGDGATTRSMAYVLRSRPPGPASAEATAGRPDAAAIRDAVWGLDRDLPIAVLQTMPEIVKRSYVEFTFTMLTLGIAALTGLILGAVGLYGVLSYAVTLRVREIGVRLALGASPGRVMRSIVGQGILVAGIGLAIGLAGAYGLTRLLSSLLFQTDPLDIATFVAMSAALLVVALLASYLPARRAAGVSPLESLRAE
jgi:predicted permease